MEPRIWEDGDLLYMVSPVSPLTPDASEIDEYAFAEQFRKMAPNDNLMWLRGQYVEADKPNLNNQMWSAGELAIKSLTPNFMPITVMHDPSTAVGLIADTRLLTPESDPTVKRSRIDTTLAVWEHRFPQVAEECRFNYKAGTLMQSMEARSPWYACGDCGQVFQKLPDHAERANWCAHLKGDGDSVLRGDERSAAARILGNVTFTGTGLIFGSRGARGANSEAHLEVSQEEVAEFHREAHERTAHTSTRPKPKQQRSKHKMEIEDRRYEELLAAEQTAKRVPDLEAKVEQAEAAKTEAEKQVETVEAEKVKAEADLKEANDKVEAAEEESQKATLATDRLGALGKGFKDKLGEFTSKRLGEQAKSLSDEEWEARLTELEEMSEVKRDEGAAEGEEEADEKGKGKGGKGDEFTREEVAAARVGSRNNGGDGAEPSPEARRTLVGSLVAPKAKSE